MRSRFVTWLLLAWVALSLISLAFEAEVHFASASTTELSASIRGGGIGVINCPLASSIETNLSFVAILFSNGTIAGNWTLYSFGSSGQSPGSIVQGPVYSGNMSLSSYEFEGDTLVKQDGIMVCDPPLFGPITISGTCGRDVMMAVEFQTDDPFQGAESFTGSADCQ